MLRWQSVISGGPNFSAAADAAIDTGDGGTFSRLMISVEIWIRLSVFDVIKEVLFPVQRHEVHPLIRFDITAGRPIRSSKIIGPPAPKECLSAQRIRGRASSAS